MKSMLTLMKVKQRELDIISEQVNKLQAKRAEIEATFASLAERLEQEISSATAMPDMAHFFGDFSSHIKKRQDQLRNLAARTEEDISKLQLAIRAIYGEIKTYEQAYKNWKVREDKKRARIEAAQMDDLALQGFVRKTQPHA